VTAKLKVAILGSTGMLGSMVLRYLSHQPDLYLRPTERSSFDAAKADLSDAVEVLEGQDYAINCIGIIKPRIDEQNAASVRRAIQVNSLFPHVLAGAAELTGCRVLQIATDCVFSGRDGGYLESCLHDPLDVYGKTKSLGEVRSSNVRHLRCSIVGPEQVYPPRPVQSLLQWFLAQPQGATVHGYTNHLWNGITTLAFARLCHGIVKNGIELPQVQHLIPCYAMDKAELLWSFSHCYDRGDIQIKRAAAGTPINRTLATVNLDKNAELWQAAGYAKTASIMELVEEMAAYGSEAL
jgi:dTDP-4-dehydrorhamnose reductase